MIEIEISQLTPTLLTILCSSLATGVSVYVAMSNRIVVLETQMKQLLYQVKQSNASGSELIRAERDLHAAFERIEELKEENSQIFKRVTDCEMTLARLQTTCDSVNKGVINHG